jgi:DNA polymerase-3 subunit alpha
MRTAEDSRAYIEGLGLDIEKLIANTHTWSELFKDFELKYDYRLPEAPEHPERYMIEVIQKNGRMKWDNPIYVQRFRDEYEVIVNNGVLNLVPYFLPLMEIHDFYKENGYLCGPARGSSAGSLIVYLLGITHIDPIKYGLSFARFLTLDRIQQSNWPDIDCDYENRDPLVGSDGYSGFLYNKYGNKAAQCSTRTLLRIKSSILDVNRFINGGTIEDDIAKLSKSLPATPQGVSDYDFIFGYEDADGHLVQGLLEQNEDLQKYALDRPKEWEIVKRALSIARQYSRHACSYLISDKPIEESVPIFEVGGVKRVTQVEHKQCEFAGLIKYDFLCVSALRDISLCMKFINIKSNAKPPAEHFIHDSKETFIWDLPENKEVFEMLGKGETETIFQLNTMTVTPYVKRIKPQNIMDLSTITSLCRPGPLDFKDEKTGNNMMEEYINRRFGHSKSDIPILDKLLPETYSVITFQEQVSRIAQELGGLSVIDAENVRIAMGKKKIKLLNSLKPKFIEGATPKIGSETAETIWSMMATFARYGFNCIAGDQLIKTNLGPVKLSKIVEKYFDYKVAYKDSCGNMQYEYPDFACSKGIKTVLTVKLSDGSILEATEDHKFLSNGEWQTLKEIIEKDLEFDCQQ